MHIQINDLETVIKLARDLMNFPLDIAHMQVVNPDGYIIGSLMYDGEFWTFNPEEYGKTND